jgi:hypothetical protein
VVREASKALPLSLVETRRCFQALVRCGFLKECKAKECKGSGYVIPGASSVEDAIADVRKLRPEEGGVAMGQFIQVHIIYIK